MAGGTTEIVVANYSRLADSDVMAKLGALAAGRPVTISPTRMISLCHGWVAETYAMQEWPDCLGLVLVDAAVTGQCPQQEQHVSPWIYFQGRTTTTAGHALRLVANPDPTSWPAAAGSAIDDMLSAGAAGVARNGERQAVIAQGGPPPPQGWGP
ncbi:MAG TPA: hypothetical protein VIC57_03845 [Candidatus Dormibacteraeota bacterium]|jgi:hypothetical protein